MKYAIGVDFGTESGRAVLVDVATGAELATAVHEYANGVIDRHLLAPVDDNVRLEPDWALQDPADYVATFRSAIPAVLAQTGVDPADVIGVGIDFTACTMLPTTGDGTPLSPADQRATFPRYGRTCGASWVAPVSVPATLDEPRPTLHWSGDICV